MPPVLIRLTWPINSSWRMEVSITNESDGTPLTSGTVGFVMKTATGTTVTGSTVSGTHIAGGVWLVTVPALSLVLDQPYHATLSVSGAGGATGQYDWWLRSVEVAPDMRGSGD